MSRSNMSLVTGYWCDTPIKLPSPLKTPLGGRVTVVTVCVDVQYSIEAGQIVLQRVELSRPKGSGLEGCNMASQRTGEAWRAAQFGPESLLVQVAQADLRKAPSALGRVMLAEWRRSHPDDHVPYIPEPFEVSVRISPRRGCLGAALFLSIAVMAISLVIRIGG